MGRALYKWGFVTVVCNMCCVPRATLTVETPLAWMGTRVLVDVNSRSDVHTHSQQVFTECLSVMFLGLRDLGEIRTL